MFARFGRLHKFVTIKKFDTSISGRRGRRPLHKSSTAAKSLRSLRTSPCAEGKYKRCRFSSSIFLSCKRRKFVFLLFPSAPLSRLAPIEALPQAPLGALPPDPHNGFHPLTLTRGVPLDLLLTSLGGSFTLLWLLSLCGAVIPHSSLSPAPHLTAAKLFKCNRFMPIALICFLLYNIFVNIYSHSAKSRYERTLLL